MHGDLYAHNILWNPVGGKALLSDFGAATLAAVAQACLRASPGPRPDMAQVTEQLHSN